MPLKIYPAILYEIYIIYTKICKLIFQYITNQKYLQDHSV